MTEDTRFHIPEAVIRIDSLPPEGRSLELDFSAEERADLAERLNISAVERLSVKLTATQFRGGIQVAGTLDAEIVQPSIVSLEPVHQAISEPISRVYLPGSEKRDASVPGAEVYVDLEGDIPDFFDGRQADLSVMIIESLALAIDPYPRGEDESLGDYSQQDDSGDDLPFAGLKVLKEPDDGA